jgi:hypothetical protein
MQMNTFDLVLYKDSVHLYINNIYKFYIYYFTCLNSCRRAHRTRDTHHTATHVQVCFHVPKIMLPWLQMRDRRMSNMPVLSWSTHGYQF